MTFVQTAEMSGVARHSRLFFSTFVTLSWAVDSAILEAILPQFLSQF